jgi:hypothetical protein
MGSDTTHRTRKTILEAARARALQVLDSSLEDSEQPNPFRKGVAAAIGNSA